MRFAGPDVVLFVAGFLLFSGSVYGLVQMDDFPPGGSAFGTYSIEWSESTDRLNLASFDSESSASFDFEVEEAGVTHILVQVTCEDATPAGSTDVTVSVKGPANQTGEADGTCGSAVRIDIPIAKAESGVVEADSKEEAEASAVENLIGDDAVGTWSGEATFSPNEFSGVTGYSGDVTAEITKAVPIASGTTR